MAGTRFETTHWSVVLAAANEESTVSRQALTFLCERYWQPLYAYVRRRGYPVEEAQDLTQEFFARLLEKGVVSGVAPGKGLFRSYLLTCLKNFLANEWDRSMAEKRGGGRMTLSIDSTDTVERVLDRSSKDLTPDRLFERQWAYTVLHNALARTEDLYSQRGEVNVFREIECYLTGELPKPSYAEISHKLGISESGVRSAVHRMRKRYRTAVQEEVAQTLGADTHPMDEVHYLISVLED